MDSECATLDRLTRMDQFIEQQRRSSAELAPIASLDDVAVFADATLQCPDGIAGRVERVAAVMRTGGVSCNEKQAAGLLQRAAGRWLSLLHRIRLGSTICTAANVTSCIACGRTKLTPARHDQCCRPWYYTEDGAVQGEMHHSRCNHCQAYHYLSYATGGLVLGEKQQFFPGVTSRDWFHLNEHTIFHTRVLQRLTTQMIHSHTGWMTFTHEYWSLTGSSMDRLRLGHHWTGWSFLQDLEENRLPLVPMEMSNISSCDATVLEWQERLHALLILQEGVNHSFVCRDPETCNGKTVITDGHMKGRRPVCPNQYARTADLGALGCYPMPCTHSPKTGSIWCAFGCEDASARRGAPLQRQNALSVLVVLQAAMKPRKLAWRWPIAAAVTKLHL